MLTCEQCNSKCSCTYNKDGKNICEECEVVHRPDKFQCSRCQKWDAQSRTTLPLGGLCRSCHFWVEKESIKDHPATVRVGGCHYIVGEEKGDPRWRGFAGAKWIIKFHDGREVTTTNLWFQGQIPERFKTDLPDNAVFVK